LIKIPCRTPGYVVEQIDDELLLYHGERTTVVYLNQTAFMIWQLCDSERSVADITALLTAVFSEDGDAIAQDVAHAVKLLVSLGVIAIT
jgi:hypothetical protein